MDEEKFVEAVHTFDCLWKVSAKEPRVNTAYFGLTFGVQCSKDAVL